MIFDRLADSDLYRKLGENFIAGFDFLRSAPLESMPDGRHDIVGSDVYAMVQSYQSKPLEQGKWEAHRHYADIQFIVRGVERIGYALLSEMTVSEPYSRDKDCEFFIGQGEFVRMEQGRFAIFLPQDVHMPGIALEKPAAVKKVVVKVRL